ncbi:MAG: hypothetical protein WCP64_07165 [Actinomycetes bacterium]
MAKPSPAKVKMLASQAKKAAAAKRAEKKAILEATEKSTVAPQDDYFEQDGNWREIGLAAPARRALIDEGFYQLSDLRKVSLAAIKELHGMGPNAIRVLVTEMKKQDLSFRG